jgi:hypothetical protein
VVFGGVADDGRSVQKVPRELSAACCTVDKHEVTKIRDVIPYKTVILTQDEAPKSEYKRLTTSNWGILGKQLRRCVLVFTVCILFCKVWMLL